MVFCSTGVPTGRESDVVILSCVRSGTEIGFLKNENRLTVALSRAKEVRLQQLSFSFTFRQETWNDDTLLILDSLPFSFCVQLMYVVGRAATFTKHGNASWKKVMNHPCLFRGHLSE
jgi:hypothetical protein